MSAAHARPHRIPLREQRIRALRELVLADGAVTVSQAVRIFGVSPMTARRDLSALSRRPGISRVHGGAVVDRGELR
jgi:DeoR/GlpR family transcriptional regulator of sugar metabolism